MAAFGTILIFISVYSFKAASYKRSFKEKTEKEVPVKSFTKVLLILFSVTCMTSGLLLILKALKVI